ncbi:hypothetical protein DSECCO2_664680 [anaerobic digester metagenome]
MGGMMVEVGNGVIVGEIVGVMFPVGVTVTVTFGVGVTVTVTFGVPVPEGVGAGVVPVGATVVLVTGGGVGFVGGTV